MKKQTVRESKVYNEAKWQLQPGEMHLCGPARNWDGAKLKRVAHWWAVRDRLTFLSQNLSRAAGRSNPVSISVTLDHLWEIGEDQDWRCAYTGVPLEFTRGGKFGYNTNPNSCTIDRIDSNRGYVKGNVQLITWIANCSKNTMAHDQYINLCKKVVEHNK